VDLLLRLVGSDGYDQREALLPAAPLLRHRIVRLLDEPGHAQTSLSSRYVALDPRVVEYLLGNDALCDPLAPFARVLPAGAESFDLLAPDLRAALATLAKAEGDGRPRTVALCGPDTMLLRAAAATVGAACGLPVLAVDAPGLVAETGAGLASRS
jgi:hypothetical protein